MSVTITTQNICERENALNSDGTVCDLSNKVITSLSSGDFDGLSNLQYLDLSFN
ncbi:MAG: leucine-rich repeat domain-containing protein, partial [Aphanocapsa feldmannii 277cV]